MTDQQPQQQEHDWHDYVDTADGRYVSESEANAEIQRLARDLADARAQRDNGNRTIERLTDEREFYREGWANWEKNAKDAWAAQEAASAREDAAVKRAQQAEQERDRLRAVVDAACAWLDNMRHGRDCTDEGYSHPREEDEDRLVDAILAYRRAALTPTQF